MGSLETEGRGLPAGLLLVIAGLLVVAVGCFLPMAEPEDALAQLDNNTLFAAGDGILFLVGVVATGILAWNWARGRVSWIAIAIFGVLGVFVGAIEVAAVAADAVWTDGHGAELATVPGIGVWAVTAGSLVVAAGAAMLRAAAPPLAQPSALPQAPASAPVPQPATPAAERPAGAWMPPAAAERPPASPREGNGAAPPLWRRVENDPPPGA